MSTMKDVASRAGVSVSTVSHVLNGTRLVSQRTRDLVLSAVEDLGYQENLLARGLKTQRTYTIGLLISDIQNPFFTALARGTEDLALSHDYHLFLCNTDEDPAREGEYITELAKKKVDGLIVAPTSRQEWSGTRGIPFVFVDREVEGIDADAIRSDNNAGMRMAVEHLVDQGHRRIGLVSGPLQKASGYERYVGFASAASRMGLDEDDYAVAYGDFRVANGREATAELLGMKDRPTALIVANNQMTVGALRATRDRGLTVPRDVSVIGFDDTEWAPLLDPPLTTVAQPAYSMGQGAARMLIERIEGDGERNTRRMLLAPQLKVRRSTSPP